MMMPSIFGENLFDDWMDFMMISSVGLLLTKRTQNQL